LWDIKDGAKLVQKHIEAANKIYSRWDISIEPVMIRKIKKEELE